MVYEAGSNSRCGRDSKSQPPIQAPLGVARRYQRLLGLEDPWTVSELVEDIARQRIDLQLVHAPGTRFACPQCQQECPVHDHAPERRWRHLDAMKFKTYLTTRPPRIRCPEHGVVSVSLPWADFSSRWTTDLEFKVIETLQACSSLQAAAKLLNLSWSTLQRAKGLEFDQVVLLMRGDGGDPEATAHDTRRLQYVAITRAKSKRHAKCLWKIRRLSGRARVWRGRG